MNRKPTRGWMLSAAMALLIATSCSDDKDPDPNPTPNTPGFSLNVSRDKFPILQGATETITVTVVREAGFEGAVDVTLSGLPSGTTATSVNIASSATTGDIKIDAGATAPHSLPTVVTVKGTSGDKSATKDFNLTVRGPPGSLDTSFATGTVITPVGPGEDYAEAIAVQSDGKIILAGRSNTGAGNDFALVRYNRDGSLDTSFGTGGKVTTAVGSGGDEAYAVAVQSDGKILAAGSADGGASGLDFALVRYNADGSLDASFGTGGKVLTALGNATDRIYAIKLQADGKILAGGETAAGATGQDFALVRYNADGSLDTSFGTGGTVVTAIASAGGRDTIFSLALQQVGGETRIVAAGGEGDFRLARYTSSGALDTSFGTGGTIANVFTSSIGSARAVTIDSAGKIVVAGHFSNDFALARLNESGALDTSFGNAGKVVTQLNPGNDDVATAVALQEDGKILVGGWVHPNPGTSGDFAVVRYDVTGALDTTFAGSGKVVTSVAAGTKNDKASALVLQTDERVPTVRVLVSGSASDNNNDFALTRYWLYALEGA